ncbi:Dom-3 Z [Actinomortierella ambigua]|nr:Dom-3 Z [Actinomortierella ambigua]
MASKAPQANEHGNVNDNRQAPSPKASHRQDSDPIQGHPQSNNSGAHNGQQVRWAHRLPARPPVAPARPSAALTPEQHRARDPLGHVGRHVSAPVQDRPLPHQQPRTLAGPPLRWNAPSAAPFQYSSQHGQHAPVEHQRNHHHAHSGSRFTRPPRPRAPLHDPNVYPLHPLERFAKRSVSFRQPAEIGSFSYDEERRLLMDDSALMYYVPPDLSKEHNLSYNYEKYVPRDPMIDERIDALLDALMDIKDKEAERHSHHSAPPVASITTADFISYRGVLTKLMCTPYTRNESWEIRATLFNGSIYLNEYVAPEKRAKNLGETERHKLMSYWGYRFETLCTFSRPSSELHSQPQQTTKRRLSGRDLTQEEMLGGYRPGSDSAEKETEKEKEKEKEVEDGVSQGYKKLKISSGAHASSGDDGESSNATPTVDRLAEHVTKKAAKEAQVTELMERLEDIVNTNVQYCTVARTRLGEHSIILGAEVDCTLHRKRPPPANPLDDYVELKTSRVIGTEREQTSYEKFKLLKFWAQSYLAGVPTIVVGFRDDDGIVRELQTLKTADIPQIVRGRRGFWVSQDCPSEG